MRNWRPQKPSLLLATLLPDTIHLEKKQGLSFSTRNVATDLDASCHSPPFDCNLSQRQKLIPYLRLSKPLTAFV
jgi:hypothetical protein